MGQMAKRAPPLLDAGRLFEMAFAVLRADPDARLQAALIVSFVLHLFVMVGVTIRAPERPFRAEPRGLDVELVAARKTTTAPEKAEILAQHNVDAGGNTDADRRARTPLPAMRETTPDANVSVKMRQAEQRESDPKRVMTQTRDPAPAVAVPDSSTRPEVQSETTPELNAADLRNAANAMVQLEAQIHRRMQEYNKRPRKTFIGSRAQEYRFARYVDDWRQKIERIGELNYPATARGTYGHAQVTVEIRADGSLEKVEINKSSGHKVLDQAALNIVRLAAPFAPFPPDVARDTDVLSITRTWNFTRLDKFQAD